MHPFVKILLLIIMLLLMNFLSNQLLWVLCSVVCIVAAWLQYEIFLRVVKRMRWLFLSIFFIYAFGTPGEYIELFPVSLTPTYEGCILGLLQIARLLIAIASLSMLFSTSSREHLMAGLYLLLSPLKLLGFNVKRFTVRLLLTLDYVDELAIEKDLKLNFNHLDALHEVAENFPADKVIVLHSVPFAIIDKIALCLIGIGALLILAYKVLP